MCINLSCGWRPRGWLYCVGENGEKSLTAYVAGRPCLWRLTVAWPLNGLLCGLAVAITINCGMANGSDQCVQWQCVPLAHFSMHLSGIVLCVAIRIIPCMADVAINSVFSI